MFHFIRRTLEVKHSNKNAKTAVKHFCSFILVLFQLLMLGGSTPASLQSAGARYDVTVT